MGAHAALIFGSMEQGDWRFLEPLRALDPMVICADGGVNCARNAGFAPDFYIGDGDSGGKPQEGIEAVVLPTQKDLTDLQAAWHAACAMGIRKMYLTGCTGGRQDHHIAALQLLEAMADRGCEGTILDPDNEISFLTPGAITLQRGGFRYFSLLPVEREITVSITGAKYPLSERRVLRGDSLCVSNEFADDEVTVTLHNGVCWLVQSRRER